MTPEDAEVLASIQRRSYARASAALKGGWPESRALAAAGIADLLGRRRYAVLATARTDARAQAAPVGFLVAEGRFWVATVAGPRVRNLRATPWASLVVMEGERDEDEAGVAPLHRALTVDGPVSLHEGEALVTVYGRLERRWLARHGHAPDWAAALVELAPERVFSHAA